MKKVFLLSAFVLGFTLMSFNNHDDGSIEQLENGNFRLTNVKISEADMASMFEMTTEFQGAGIFKKTFIVSQTREEKEVSKFTETVIASEGAKSDETIQLSNQIDYVNNLIAKYDN